MSKVVKIFYAVSWIIYGALSGNWLLVVQGTLLLSSTLAQKGPGARQAQTATLQIGEVPRMAAFGRVALAGSLVDAFNWGGKYGTDWEAQVIALADHRCRALVGFYVNDVYYPFTGNGSVAGFNNQLVIKWFDGSEGQGVGDDMLNHGGWSTNDNLAGVSYVLASYEADSEKAKNPIWTAGRPRFLFVLDGAHCYDPRKDSTVAGGSGAHRWADPTTWEWSDNVSVCRYNWARGIFACDRVDQPEMLLVGRGLSAIEAPPENVIWRANICDELVPLAAGGSEKRYRCGVVIKADETFDTTEQLWAAACAGVIRQPEGSVEVDPGHAVTPTFAITDDDLLIGAKVSFSRFRNQADNEWCNTVIPTYTEPGQKWVSHSAPIRRVYGDVIADGGAREVTLQLDAVTSGTQAQRCGEIVRRMGRLLRTGSVTLGPRFAGIEEGDWGTFTSARHTGGVPVTVRAEAMGLNQKWQNGLQLREMAASIFDWTTADEIAEGAVAIPNPVPVYGGAPDVAEWSASGGIVQGTNGEAIPAVFIAGGVIDPYAQYLLVEYRQRAILLNEDGHAILTEDGHAILAEGDPPDWTVEASLSPLTTSYTLRGLAAGASYEVAISYAVRGVVGDRLVLGPVIAGTLGVSRACYELRTLDPAFPVTPGDTSMTIVAFTAVLDDGRSMAFPADTITGLASGTSYGLFWNLSSGAYEADVAPAMSRRASSLYVFLEFYTTSTGGVFAGVAAPPPGFGGGGPREVNLA